MGEYQMTNSYGLKTPEQWQQESILTLRFHYDHVEACFKAEQSRCYQKITTGTERRSI